MPSGRFSWVFGQLMLPDPLRDMNSEGFPEEESRGERDVERVLGDVRGELALGVWGRLPSNLVTSLGKGERFWIIFPDVIHGGDHARVSCIQDEKKQPQIVPGQV